MKKMLAVLLATALACPPLTLITSAADNIIGHLVDGDGKIAESNAQNVKPGDYYYYVIGPSEDYDTLTNSNYFRFSLRKKTNGKYISDGELREKKFDNTRYVVIQFQVKDFYTEDEYKIELEAQFKAREDMWMKPGKNADIPRFVPITSSNSGYDGTDWTQRETAKNNLKTAETELNTAKQELTTVKNSLAEKETLFRNALTETGSGGLRAAIDTAYGAGKAAEAFQSLPDVNSWNADNAQTHFNALKKKIETFSPITTIPADLQQKIDTLEKQIDDLSKDLNKSTDLVKKIQEEIEKQSKLQDQIASFDMMPINASTNPKTDLEIAQVRQNKLDELVQAQNTYQTKYDELSLLRMTDLNDNEEIKPLLDAVKNTLTSYRQAYPNNKLPENLDSDEHFQKFKAQIAPSADPVNAPTEYDDVSTQLKNAIDAEKNALQKKIEDSQKIQAEQESALQPLLDKYTGATKDNLTIKIQEQLTIAQQQLDALPQPIAPPVAALNADVSGKLDTIEKLIQEASRYQTDTVKPAQTKVEQKQTEYDNAKKAYDTIVSGKNAVRATVSQADKDHHKLNSGDTYQYDMKFWIANERVEDDDADFTAGENGVVVRPIPNEWNTITWENNRGPIARMKFMADSNTEYICPRLSTKWTRAYDEYFNHDTDAYLFDFVGNPNIPATTRATVELYYPFLDDDGNPYVRPSRVYVYQVDRKGNLLEMPAVEYGENDDGDLVLSFRTRTLGTYIVSDSKAHFEEDEDDIIIITPPSINVEHNTDKKNPGTGF